MKHRPSDELFAGVDHIRHSPHDDGRLELIVRRPATGEREVLVEAVLDLTEGLVGDMWRTRPSSKTGDGSAHPDMQVTVMNARCAALVAVEPERRALAGDQLYVDLTMGRSLRIGDTPIRCRSLLDLSGENPWPRNSEPASPVP